MLLTHDTIHNLHCHTFDDTIFMFNAPANSGSPCKLWKPRQAPPMFDETRERLKFRVQQQQMFVTMEVFVLRVVAVWGWRDSKPHFLEMLVPALPVPNTSADAVRNAKRNHPWTKPCWDFCQELLALALFVAMKFGVLDAASGNDLYAAGELTEFPDLVAQYIHCLSHQSMLGTLDFVFGVFGHNFLRKLNAMATFYNLSFHRMRMYIVVLEVLQSIAYVVPVQEDADKAYAAECCIYYSRWAEVALRSNKRARNKKRGKCAEEAGDIQETQARKRINDHRKLMPHAADITPKKLINIKMFHSKRKRNHTITEST